MGATNLEHKKGPVAPQSLACRTSRQMFQETRVKSNCYAERAAITLCALGRLPLHIPETTRRRTLEPCQQSHRLC